MKISITVENEAEATALQHALGHPDLRALCVSLGTNLAHGKEEEAKNTLTAVQLALEKNKK